jgi:acetyl-CoA acetyltransferase
MLQHARRAIESGDASVIVIVAGDSLEAGGFRDLVDSYNSATRDHLAEIPFGGPNSVFALLTRRHMRAHGLGRETYGRLVVAQRAWAVLNPGAVYRVPLTLEEYLSAPLVSDPLGRYDCVPIVSGADAVVVAAGARPKPAVAVGALATSVNADDQQSDGLRTGLADVAGLLWEESGLGPEDVDVAAVYDDYPAVILIQLSDLGFVSDGDLDRFVRTRIASRSLPLNTSGGQLSAGQAGAAGGLHGLVEVVRQLRGDAADRQVNGAEVGLVSGYGMVAYRYGACANAAVLRRIG